MKRILSIIVAIAAVAGCQKEETSLEGSKWVSVWGNYRVCLEFVSESDVRLYTIDSYDNFMGSLYKDTYFMNAADGITFRGRSIPRLGNYNYKIASAVMDKDVMTVTCVLNTNEKDTEESTFLRVD